jgi:hypothetical protein
MPAKRNIIENITHFMKRDSDITYKAEFHYIYITLRETISIFKKNLTDVALNKLSIEK